MNSIAELTKEIERLTQLLADKDLALMEQQEIAQAANRQAEAAQSIGMPFMYAIMGPDGTAHIDENCVSASADSTALHIEVNCLDDSPDTGYSIVPVYLAAPQQHAQPVHQFRKACAADWYDGHPDNEDGGGPYEVRTLYSGPQQHAQAAPNDEPSEALLGAIMGRAWEDCGNGMQEDARRRWKKISAILAKRQPAPIDRAAIHRKVLESGMDGPDVLGPTVCTVPPAEWYCTRVPGHDGPCAAHPVAPVAAAVEQVDDREEFEAAVGKLAKWLYTRNADGTYQEIAVQGFWSIWQAAIAWNAVSQDSERDAALWNECRELIQILSSIAGKEITKRADKALSAMAAHQGDKP